MSQNYLENNAAIRNREIRRDISKWKNDKFLATTVNLKCPPPKKKFKFRSQKAGESTNLKVRAGEVHLSYFHIEEIFEIIGRVGIGIA